MSVCSVDGCDKKIKCKKLCNNHYMIARRNNGNPISSKTKHGLPSKYLDEQLAIDTDDCQEWPFSCNTNGGHGRIRIDGSPDYVTREALRRVGILTPDKEHLMVLHQPLICHNPKCFNPKHLRLGTCKDNHADMFIDGTRRRGKAPRWIAGLENKEVLIISSLIWQGYSEKFLSEIFETSEDTIQFIKNGATYY